MLFSTGIRLLLTCLSLLFLWQFRTLLLLIFTSVVLATILNKEAVCISKVFKINRSTSVKITLGSIVFLFAILVLFIVPPFIDQFIQLIKLSPVAWENFSDYYENFRSNIASFLGSNSLDRVFPDLNDLNGYVFNYFPQAVSDALALFSNYSAGIFQVFLVLILTVMFLSAPRAYSNLFINLFPADRQKTIRGKLFETEKGLFEWFKATVLNSLFVAFCCGGGLIVLSIPYVFSLSVIAGIFNFIPNIGPFISLIFPVAIALINSPQKAVAVIVLYVVVQQTETYWFSPKIMGEKLNILPAVTLLIQVVFASLFGFLGLLLALPLGVTLRIWLEKDLFTNSRT